jgi:hypothetical protein
MKKGVYVDNLSEHSVVTVNDVLRLLVHVEFCKTQDFDCIVGVITLGFLL